MKKKKWLLFSVLFIFLLIGGSTFYFITLHNKSTATAKPLSQASHSLKTNTDMFKTLEETITLGAIGDILIHDWVYEDAQLENGYDFTPMFKYIESVLKEPDILLANQETLLGGEEIGISSYPTFNSPQEVGDALVSSGVDIVSTANNHSLDKGERGQLASLDYLDKIGLPHVGTYRNETERQTLTIMEQNGISVAYLSYTYGTNGIPVPKGKEYLVNLIDKERMKEEIERAKENADIVVMSLHWGNEYQRFPTSAQKELGQYLIDAGVDILFGHHPHVLQPMEWAQSTDGRTALIVYSLGNFLSGQMWDYKDIGGMATIDVTKTLDKNGTVIKLSNPKFYPTFVSSKNLQNYRVVPLQDAESFGLKNAAAKYIEIMNHMIGAL